MLTLRPYQEVILAELRQQLRAHRAVLVCAPCGAGKGSLIAWMVASAVGRGKRVIFVVRGKALVHDMSARVMRLGLEHGVLMGDIQTHPKRAVQVASIDTLFRRNPVPLADLIIIDEARTFMSPTGRKVLDAYPDALIVGADATPERRDGLGLGTEWGGVFDAMVMGPNEQDLIDLGFLVPSVVIGIPDPPDMTGVSKTGGEFNRLAMAAICDKVKLVGDIVEHWQREAAGLKTVAFAVNKAHALHITERFREAGIEWEYVDDGTSDRDREAIWRRLDRGTLMGFSNVGIAGVGWDHPCIQCIIAARPTASLSLWRQMIGRGSRPHPGKARFVILDHANNTMRHWPYGFFETPPRWSLEGGKARSIGSDGPQPPPIATCKRPVRVPDTGVPGSFTGPLSNDGLWMLPSFHIFVSGPEICPYCGLPLKEDNLGVPVKPGTLKDLAALKEKARLEAKAKMTDPQKAREERMKERYRELETFARAKGYKPGYPAVMFKNEFNRWPEKSWKT